jgi:hypothetical protein
MAKRVWQARMAHGTPRGEGPYSLKGFEEGHDSNSLVAKKVLDGLEFEDLKSIYSEIHEILHGDEHG